MEIRGIMDAKKYQVFDTNQRGTDPRKHDVITKLYEDAEPDIKTYALYSDKPCEMPMEHAMRFLVDGSFRVLSPTGKRIMPVAKLDVSKPISKLAEDEVVAKYDELSTEALYRRVKILPGSEGIEEIDRDKMVAFMVTWRRQLQGMSSGERELATMMAQGQLDGALSDSELETMFPKQKLAA
jgi:hypothetical protein